jgi:hypothetical protein
MVTEKPYMNYRIRFAWLAVFAVAMGFLEGIVVIYLREIYYPDGFKFPLSLLSPELVSIEWIREISTLIMLVAAGIITGRNNRQRLFYALFAFGVWDIFYYVALKLLIGWPASLLTWDLLFLIPLSWLGPVLAPVINSLTMIVMAIMIIGREEKRCIVKIAPGEWAMIFGGGLVILYTYLIDFSRLILQSGILSGGSTAEEEKRLTALVTSYVPDRFAWLIFIAGEAMIIVATFLIMKRAGKKNITIPERPADA